MSAPPEKIGSEEKYFKKRSNTYALPTLKYMIGTVVAIIFNPSSISLDELESAIIISRGRSV